MPETSERTRSLILAVTVILGLAVASIPLVASVFSSPTPPAAAPRAEDGVVEPQATAAPDSAPVSMAHPRPCPAGEGAAVASDSELKGIALPCLTDGARGGEQNLGQALAGKPTVINVWAWWCGPCRAELPLMEQLAQRHPEWNVVGVHLDGKAQAGADMLRDLGVHKLVSYQDAQHRFDSATGIPKVVPLTLVYRADGSRAQMLARTFDNLEELDREVSRAL